MSTEYMPSRRIAIERIKDFNHNGVSARLVKGYVLLSDGVSGMWAFPASWGRRVTFVCKGDKNVTHIIEALEEYFKMTLVSEHESMFHEIRETEYSMAHSCRRGIVGTIDEKQLLYTPDDEEEQ